MVRLIQRDNEMRLIEDHIRQMRREEEIQSDESYYQNMRFEERLGMFMEENGVDPDQFDDEIRFLTNAELWAIQIEWQRQFVNEGLRLSEEDREERLIERLDAHRPQRESRRMQRIWKRNENPQCSICQDHRHQDTEEFLPFTERPTRNWVEFPCSGKHKFHCKCIERWLMENTKCPYCRGGHCTDWDLLVMRSTCHEGDLIQLRPILQSTDFTQSPQPGEKQNEVKNGIVGA